MSGYDQELIKLYEATHTITKIKELKKSPEKHTSRRLKDRTGKCENCKQMARLFDSWRFGKCCAPCIQWLLWHTCTVKHIDITEMYRKHRQ